MARPKKETRIQKALLALEEWREGNITLAEIVEKYEYKDKVEAGISLQFAQKYLASAPERDVEE